MSKQKMTEHALRYSQTFKSKTQWVKESSKWTTDFDAMALKTVTKLNLSKNGPLSVEMQKAMITDQGVIKDSETLEVSYEDNKLPEPITVDDLLSLYEEKKELLSEDDRKNAERIIFNKEEVSYPKLQKELNAK